MPFRPPRRRPRTPRPTARRSAQRSLAAPRTRRRPRPMLRACRGSIPPRPRASKISPTIPTGSRARRAAPRRTTRGARDRGQHAQPREVLAPGDREHPRAVGRDQRDPARLHQRHVGLGIEGQLRPAAARHRFGRHLHGDLQHRLHRRAEGRELPGHARCQRHHGHRLCLLLRPRLDPECAPSAVPTAVLHGTHPGRCLQGYQRDLRFNCTEPGLSIDEYTCTAPVAGPRRSATTTRQVVTTVSEREPVLAAGGRYQLHARRRSLHRQRSRHPDRRWRRGNPALLGLAARLHLHGQDRRQRLRRPRSQWQPAISCARIA
jgi:hypothetical protein